MLQQEQLFLSMLMMVVWNPHSDSELSLSDSENELKQSSLESLIHSNLPGHGGGETSQVHTCDNSSELHPTVSLGDFGKVVLLKSD